MTFRKSAPRAKSRWLTLMSVVAMISLLFVAGATATVSPSTFEGDDGNKNVDTTGNMDWSNVPAAMLHDDVDRPSGTTDNSFGGGSKEDLSAVTVVTGSIPPNKNDLTRFLEASETVGGNTFLYLGWERAVNIGNANLDFEINHAATAAFTATATGKITLNRTAGDLLVTYDFGGSGTPTIGLRRWTGSAWGASTSVPVSSYEAAVSADGLFGEASINLTTAGVFPAGGPCESFGSAFLKSRSSSSFTAELKDFIAPTPVEISNCGTIKVIKQTAPRGANQSFSFSTNVPSGSATNAATFSKTPATTGTTTTFTLNDNGNTSANSAGNTETITNVHPGSYTVTEGTTSGWTLSGLVCTATGTGTSATPTTSTATATANITVAAGGVATCTYTNVQNKATPGATSAPSLIPQDKVTVANLDPNGAVSSTANKVMTVSLYGASNAECTGSPVYSETFTVTDNGDYVTTNGGAGATATATKTAGYTITSDGTYKWKVHYNGDSRNDPFDVACGDEQVVVQLSPNP